MSEILHKPLISEGNTTSVLLVARETFKGLWEDITDYSTVGTTVLGSGATDGILYIDVSNDKGETFTSLIYNIANISTLTTVSEVIIENYVRIRFINGVTDQSGTFAIETIYSNNSPSDGSSTEAKQDEVLIELKESNDTLSSHEILLEAIKSQVETNQSILEELQEIKFYIKGIAE